MLRSLAAACLVGMVVTGCVGIDPPSGSVRPTQPSPAISTLPPVPPRPTKSAAPTLAPAPASQPTAGPTSPSPTPNSPATTLPATPVAPASPGASGAPVKNYGASTPLINDGFDDPSTGWGVGTNAGGSISYGSYALVFETAAANSWLLSTVQTGATSNAVHVETVFTPSGAGVQGLLCANSDAELWGATENAAGQYAFIKVDGNGPQVLSQGQLDSLRAPADNMSRFALDCAGTATGSFRMQLSAPGTNQAVEYAGSAGDGPPAFDRVGVYAESVGHPYSLSVDFVIAFGGRGDTAMSAAAVALLDHVPVPWQPKCFEAFATVFYTGVQADILCQLSDGRSDYAEYTSFDTQADMYASFQYLVGRWAVPESGVNCDTGPHQGTYTIGGVTAGKILCAPSVTGTQFDWTTDDLLILSSLIDLEGRYPDMYTDWLDAGPN